MEGAEDAEKRALVGDKQDFCGATAWLPTAALISVRFPKKVNVSAGQKGVWENREGAEHLLSAAWLPLTVVDTNDCHPRWVPSSLFCEEEKLMLWEPPSVGDRCGSNCFVFWWSILIITLWGDGVFTFTLYMRKQKLSYKRRRRDKGMWSVEDILERTEGNEGTCTLTGSV